MPSSHTFTASEKVHGCLAVLAGVAFVMAHVSFADSFGAMQSAVGQSLGVSHLGTATLGAAYLAAYGLCQIPAGMLLDRYGPRPILGISSGAATLAMIGFALAPDFWTAAISRGLAGIATAFAFSGAALLARRRLPNRWFTPALGLLEGAIGLGGAAGLVVVGILLDDFSWRGVAWLTAALAGVSWLLCMTLIRPAPAEGGLPELQPPTAPVWESLREAWSSSHVRFCCLIYAVLLGETFAFAGFWNIQLLESWDIEPSQAIDLSAWLLVGVTVSAVIAGAVGSNASRMRLILFWSNVAGVALLAVQVFSPWPDKGVPVIVLMLLLGAAMGPACLVFSLATAGTPLSRTGTVIALVNTTGLLGAVVLQLIPGLVLWVLGSDSLDAYQGALVVVLVLSALAAWAALRLRTDLGPFKPDESHRVEAST